MHALAPFLDFDGDPYPVALNGRVLWVLDGYTTSDLYPVRGERRPQPADLDERARSPVQLHPQQRQGHRRRLRRDVTFYAIDDVDPVLKVWESAFPGLFRPSSEMPDGLADHLRYPEELFRIQTAAYSKYQLPPSQFFDRIGAWSVAQAPPNQAQPTVTPTVGRDPGDRREQPAAGVLRRVQLGQVRAVLLDVPGARRRRPSTFELYRPFVQFSTNDDRRELQAFMTASSDPATYGRLVAYTVNDELPNGPLQVANTMAQDPLISQQVTLIDQRGSQVVLGDLQMIPVAERDRLAAADVLRAERWGPAADEVRARQLQRQRGVRREHRRGARQAVPRFRRPTSATASTSTASHRARDDDQPTGLDTTTTDHPVDDGQSIDRRRRPPGAAGTRPRSCSPRPTGCSSTPTPR